MDKILWTKLWFYGNILLTTVIFFILLDKRRIKELIPVGLLIAATNYTTEIIGLHFKLWHYPLSNPGYMHGVILFSLVYFPMLGMLFAQHLTCSIKRNTLLILMFLSLNIIVEVITLKTTDFFIYSERMNLLVSSLLYFAAYLMIILFHYLYK